MVPGSEEMTALARLPKVADETARGDERMDPVAAQPGSTVSEVTGAIGTAKTTALRCRHAYVPQTRRAARRWIM